jgi:hypothetical protein
MIPPQVEHAIHVGDPLEDQQVQDEHDPAEHDRRAPASDRQRRLAGSAGLRSPHQAVGLVISVTATLTMASVTAGIDLPDRKKSSEVRTVRRVTHPMPSTVTK